MPFFHPRSASSESYTSSSSSITFSNETGPGAHAPLGALPRRAQRKSLFHIQNDDDTPPTPPLSSPPDTPPEPAHQDPVGIPFPSSSSAVSGPLSPSTPNGPLSPPAIVRSGSSSIILSNGKPLKPSLKSSSSSSISDAWAAQQQNAGNSSTNRSLHTRAQSMPSTPAFTPKNVHFQEDERLATVRVFRSTGRPRSVSTQNDDTETETEVEQPRHLSAYPFPAMGPSSSSTSRTPLSNSPLAPIMDIDPSPMRTSPIPSPTASPYANVHLESISLPPSRPPVLRGAILVRNVSFEKRVSVRFTLDDWTTVSEVSATYASSLSAPHPVLPTASPATIGDIMARQPGSATTTTNQWDRFNFAIRLEDYEARLADRTLVLAAAYSAPGVGDWWDNNAGANYRVGFRPRAPPSSSSSSNPIPTTQPIRSKPSTSPFLHAAAPPPAAPRNTVNISSAFSSSNGGSGTGTPPRPAQLVRSVSTPSAPTARTLGRLALKHYAAPAPPALSMPERRPSPPSASSSPERKQQTSPLKIFGGQFATQVENGADKVKKSGAGEEEVHVDEGFETGSDDDDEDKIATPTSASPVPRRAVKPGLHIPSAPTPTLAARGPFSPTRASPVPFGSASPVGGGVVEGRGDATYAALIREWCFAQGDATGGSGAATTAGVAATTTVGSGLGMPGKQNMLWVGMGG